MRSLALAVALVACVPEDEAFQDEELEELVLELEEADDVGDTRATAEPFWPRYGDVLDSPTDVDWFVVTNNGVTHSTSRFSISATSTVRCQVYAETAISAT